MEEFLEYAKIGCFLLHTDLPKISIPLTQICQINLFFLVFSRYVGKNLNFCLLVSGFRVFFMKTSSYPYCSRAHRKKTIPKIASFWTVETCTLPDDMQTKID